MNSPTASSEISASRLIHALSEACPYLTYGAVPISDQVEALDEHRRPQLLVELFSRPGSTKPVLRHLEARYRYAAGVGRLTRRNRDAGIVWLLVARGLLLRSRTDGWVCIDRIEYYLDHPAGTRTRDHAPGACRNFRHHHCRHSDRGAARQAHSVRTAAIRTAGERHRNRPDVSLSCMVPVITES